MESEMSRSPRRSGGSSRGFTILEVIIATAILIIAVSAMAALAANTIDSALF